MKPGVAMEVGTKKSKKNSHKRGKNLALTISKSGEIKKVNDKSIKTFGYQKDEIKNKSFFKHLIPKKYSTHWEKKFDSAIKNSCIDDFKLPILTKNGHELMFSWSSFPIKNSKGKVEDISIVGSFVDSWDDSIDSYLPSWDEIEEPKVIEKESKHASDKLELQNQYLKDENKYLKKKLTMYLDKFSDHGDHDTDYLGFTLYRFSDFFGGKKRKEEIDSLVEHLQEREDYLNKLESNLMKEKKDLNQQKIKFIKWHKKLETLESEIESRFKWVENKEKLLKKYSNESDNSVFSRLKSSDVEEYTLEDLNNREDCAAVVQRGVFRQVTSSFTDFFGYNPNEIIDKSIFDFIDPSGFSDVEDYYFNRLKGDASPNFSTVFLTADGKKVTVDVDARSAFFDGNKVEIFVFKKDSELKEDSKNISTKDDISQDESSENSGSKLNQDQISAMFEKEDNTDSDDAKDSKAPVKQGGVPGVVTQDQIDKMVKKAKNDTIDNKDSKKDGSSNVKNNSSAGKLNQDQISDMFDKNRSGDEPLGSGKDNSDESIPPVKQGGVPGVVTQDQIDRMVEKNKQEQPEEKIDEKEDGTKKDKVEDKKKDKPKEKDSEEKSSSSSGKMGQDDIDSLIKKMQKEKEE